MGCCATPGCGRRLTHLLQQVGIGHEVMTPATIESVEHVEKVGLHGKRVRASGNGLTNRRDRRVRPGFAARIALHDGAALALKARR